MTINTTHTTMLRAITVCVDFADILSLTLPYNRHHFSEYMVVTSSADIATEQLALANHCTVYETDSFYTYDPYPNAHSTFAKWLALEQALDAYGRHGWLCILDADVLWPKTVQLDLKEGCLHSPLRRMYPYIPAPGVPIPAESLWSQYPLHRNIAEHAGYTQIFHASDPHLGTPPWHQTDWIHAGGADSMFQARWPPACKRRPPWQVLHLGEAGVNWLGRTSKLADGTIPDRARERRLALRRLIQARTTGPDRFKAEKRGTVG